MRFVVSDAITSLRIAFPGVPVARTGPPTACGRRRTAMFITFLVFVADPRQALAVRPFVTDDARVVYPGQLEMENYAEIATAKCQKPGYTARSLQGTSLTDRLEIIAGGFGPVYENKVTRPVDVVFQPKYLLYRGFGATPSVSAAVAELFPLSGNKQLWNSYAMFHVSWFLFMPPDSTDPYDNGLAVHINLGTKSQYNAGPTTYSAKLYWAAGFEAITFSREFRFLSEVFSGDPFTFEEKAPVYQSGFRWYVNPNLQWDVVWRGVRGEQEHSNVFQLGLRILFDDVFPLR